jgi:hypothetical protein
MHSALGKKGYILINKTNPCRNKLKIFIYKLDIKKSEKDIDCDFL